MDDEIKYGFKEEEPDINGLPSSIEKKLSGMRERLKNPRKSTGTASRYHGRWDVVVPYEILFCGEALSDGAKLLWMLIRHFSSPPDGPPSPYFPAKGKLAKYLGKKEPRVNSWMKELKEAGLLVVTPMQREDEYGVHNYYDLPDIEKWWKKRGRILKKENKVKKEGKYKNIERYREKKRELKKPNVQKQGNWPKMD